MEMSTRQEEQAFVGWCQSNLSVIPVQKTLENKARLLGILVKKYGLNPEDPNAETVISNITKAAISARTMKTYKTVLKQWLQSKGIEISDELKKGLKHRSGQRVRITHPNDLVTKEELADIIDHTASQALKTYLLVLYDTGARPGAVCKLDVSDVAADKYGFVLNFRHVKTEQSQRPVRLMDPLSIRHLEVWLSVHPRNKEPDAPLFLNRYGRRFNVESVLNILRKFHNERLGRGKKKNKASLSPYLFRKSRATQLLRDGTLSDVEVRQRLGHRKDSRVLEAYYDIRDETDQAQAELKAMGIIEVKDKAPQRICPNCSMPNEASASECLRCKHPLTEEAAVKQLRAAIETADIGKMVEEQTGALRKELNETTAALARVEAMLADLAQSITTHGELRTKTGVYAVDSKTTLQELSKLLHDEKSEHPKRPARKKKP